MKSKSEAHRNAFLLAFALTAFIVGVGCIQVASAYDDDHMYYVPITPWGWMRLMTTAYNSGPYLGTVYVSQAAFEGYPLGVLCSGFDVATVDSYTKLAYGNYVVYIWGLPAYYPVLYTEITYEATNNFYYDDWMTW